MASPPITAVTFDVWETLIKDQLQPSRSRGQLRSSRMAGVLARYGYAIGEARVHDIYRATLHKLAQDYWSKYLDLGTRDQLLVFLSLIDPQLVSPAEEAMLADIEEAYTSPFFEIPPSLAPGAEWALETIRRKGLPLALVCNTGVTPGKDIWKLLEGYGVSQYFQAAVFSGDERIRKPRPEIFLRAIERLGASLAQAVHVGDDAGTDIAGAKGAGMRAIMVRASQPRQLPVPPDALVSDLFGVPGAIEGL